ncbi:hypothetical protein [Streptomyces sp. NPDC090080]|uniref:hypothetical protein n=1 Tax=Streptomyces sp. NPDC090080 TaxID=3365939 RepID=UPI00380F9BFE
MTRQDAARRIAADVAVEAAIDSDRISLTVTLRAAHLTVINATDAMSPFQPQFEQVR